MELSRVANVTKNLVSGANPALLYWKDTSNQLRALKEIEKRLHIKDPSDWYNYGKKDIIENGGSRLLHCYGSSLRKMLQSLYPDFNWNLAKYKL
jgi:hypothetical protein